MKKYYKFIPTSGFFKSTGDQLRYKNSSSQIICILDGLGLNNNVKAKCQCPEMLESSQNAD